MNATPLAPWKRHLMLVVALFILVSSLAHSFLGWRALGPQIVASGAPEELVGSLAVGWHFGGVAMAAFAVILFAAWRRSRTDAAGASAPVAVIAVAYIVFGTAAFVARGFEPFFMIFIVPGVALAACAWGAGRKRPA